jgi:hypothetical protein
MLYYVMLCYVMLCYSYVTVMLQLCLRHDIYNAIFTTKHNYIHRPRVSPPSPNEKFWMCTCYKAVHNSSLQYSRTEEAQQLLKPPVTTVIEIRDFGFSQFCYRRFHSSGMWLWAGGRLVPGVSTNRGHFPCKGRQPKNNELPCCSTLNIKALKFFQISGNTRPKFTH